MQSRNDKFERTILVNVHVAVLGPGRVSNAESMLRKDHQKNFPQKKKKGYKRNKDATYSVLVIDHFVRVSKGYHNTRAFLS